MPRRVTSAGSASTRGVHPLPLPSLFLLTVSPLQEWASLKEAVSAGTPALPTFGPVAQGLALKCLDRSEPGTAQSCPAASRSALGNSTVAPSWALDSEP